MNLVINLILTLLLCFTFHQTANQVETKGEKDIPLYAKSAVLMDAKTGRVLYEKDGELKLPNASTTKILTCILAIEHGKLEDVVTISPYAAGMPKVKLGAKSGEQFYMKDLPRLEVLVYADGFKQWLLQEVEE